jgi:hypothetical protein
MMMMNNRVVFSIAQISLVLIAFCCVCSAQIGNAPPETDLPQGFGDHVVVLWGSAFTGVPDVFCISATYLHKRVLETEAGASFYFQDLNRTFFVKTGLCLPLRRSIVEKDNWNWKYPVLVGYKYWMVRSVSFLFDGFSTHMLTGSIGVETISRRHGIAFRLLVEPAVIFLTKSENASFYDHKLYTGIGGVRLAIGLPLY